MALTKALPDLQRARSYVARHVVPLMAATSQPEIGHPRYGSTSEVYLLHWPDGTAAVLRVFESIREFRLYERAMRHALDRGAPVPALLLADARWTTRLRWRRAFAVEQFIDGQLAIEHQPLEPHHVDRILDALAALHDITTPQWGHLDNLHAGPYNDEVWDHTRSILDGIPTDSPGLRPGEAVQWSAAMRTLWAQLPAPTAYSLIHRHLAADDIMLPADGTRAILLDNMKLRYGHWAYDLEDVLDFLAGDDDGRREELVAAYLARRTATPPGTDYRLEAPYFRADWHLKKLRSALRSRSRGRTGHDDKIARYLTQLRRLLAPTHDDRTAA